MSNPTRFECYIYEVGSCKKDLGLSINLEDFDPSKLSLVVNDLNEDNFSILYVENFVCMSINYMLKLSIVEILNRNILALKMIVQKLRNV